MKRGLEVRRAARTFGRLLAAAMTVVLAAGCAKQPIITREVPKLNKDDVMSILNNNAQATRSIRADLAVKFQTEGMNSPEGCGGDLAAQYPNKLRILGRHDLLAYPPFDVGSDGQEWFWHGHFQKFNQMHYGPTAYLDQTFVEAALLKPADVVFALGVGPLIENPSSQLYFTREPGFYVFTEVFNDPKGFRYIRKKIWVDGDLLTVSRMETYRPDAGIDMIAEMKYDAGDKAGKNVPVSADIRLLRNQKFRLDLTLRDRKTNVALKDKLFATPPTEGIPDVQYHGGDAATKGR